RRRSSGSRSVSLPVNARTSHVLPWSMCPAVPTVSGTSSFLPGALNRGGHCLDVVVLERAAVEQQAAVADDPDDRRVAQSKGCGQALLDRTRKAVQLRERQRPAADAG